MPSAHEFRILFRSVSRRQLAVALGLISLSSLTEGLKISSLFLLLPVLGFDGVGNIERLFGPWAQQLEEGGLLLISGLIVGIFAFHGAINIAQGYFVAKLQYGCTEAFRLRFFDAVLNAEWRLFLELKSGDLVNAVISSAGRAGSAFQSLLMALSNCLTVAVYLGIALTSSWALTLFMLGLGGIGFLCTRFLVKKSGVLGDEFTEVSARLQCDSNELFRNIKYVKASRLERYVSKRIATPIRSVTRIGKWMGLIQPGLVAAFELVGVIGLLVSVGVGGYYFGVSEDVLVVVLLLFARIFPRLGTIQQYLQVFSNAAPGATSMEAIVDLALRRSESKSQSDGVRGSEAASVEFADVSVDYGESRVLNRVSFRVEGGEFVAMIGRSGSGKTTALDCILGLHPLSEGTISIRRRDGTLVHPHSVRDLAGYVMQDTLLFNDTVAENIRVGSQADESDLWRALAESDADGFIRERDGGLNEVVGDGGVFFSGGQKQRLGLARALVRCPGLLILDEATSALDHQSGERVVETVSRLAGKMTIVMVTHNLDLVKRAGKVIVFEEGRAVAIGTYDTLQEEGAFRSLLELSHRDGG